MQGLLLKQWWTSARDYIKPSANIPELLLKLLSKPQNGGAALGVKQVARTATVIIRGAETVLERCPRAEVPTALI